jgi:phosphopantothenoylcysteine decarboxylase/phosphopantothenate--cysteine ligase
MKESNLEGKRILLGVTGSIAAYKAAVVASQLTKAGAEVDVILTEAGARFVTPLTFGALTGRPVYTSMWEAGSGGERGAHISHIGLAHAADLLAIIPATANTMARIAHGLADDLLSLTALAAPCPLVIAPAMDAGMYEAPATQENVETLRERGAHIAGPGTGRMASGLEGAGRLLEPDELVGHIRLVLGRGGTLEGRRVVVTAGPTVEALDPVRVLTNRSTGKQGFAVAQAAVDAGADVTLIAGPVAIPTPVGAQRVDVESAREMAAEVLSRAGGDDPVDVLIMAAAVADFRPAEQAEQKIKKAGGAPALELAANPDILAEVAGGVTRPRVVVGFAAESENLIANAQEKLARKKLDMIAANDVTGEDAGFAAETNRVHLITREGVETLPLMSKAAVGARIAAWVADRLSTG